MGQKNRFKYIFISLVCGLLFLILGIVVKQNYIRGFDLSSMVSLQSLISRKLDLPFSYLTLLGSTEVTILILAILFCWQLFKRRRVFWGLFLFIYIYIFEIAGKLYIYQPSPPNYFHRYNLGFHFPSSFFVHTDYSYPSGHMARTTFLIVLLVFFIWKNKNENKKPFFLILLFLYFIMTFISRIYLGEHWMSDVIGGSILGISIASLSIGLL